jgi:hypothetical protein
MKQIKRNSRNFNFVLNNIQTAKPIGGGDPRLLTTVKSVVQACRDMRHFKLFDLGNGEYEIQGTSCSWKCTF